MYSNPIFTADGNINVEFDHPKYGVIPCTLSPNDPETAEAFAEVSKMAVAPYVAPIKSPEQLAAENNAPLLAEIAGIEAKCIRSVRELLLSPSDVTARKYLQDSEAAIELLRGQLL